MPGYRKSQGYHKDPALTKSAATRKMLLDFIRRSIARRSTDLSKREPATIGCGELANSERKPLPDIVSAS